MLGHYDLTSNAELTLSRYTSSKVPFAYRESQCIGKTLLCEALIAQPNNLATNHQKTLYFTGAAFSPSGMTKKNQQ